MNSKTNQTSPGSKRKPGKAAHEFNHYKEAFKHSLLAIMITRPDGRILEANRQACLMFGYTEKELQKIGRQGIILPNKQLIQKVKERKKTGRASGELTGIRKNGQPFPLVFSSVIFKDKEGKDCSCNMMSDLTEKKRTAQEMRWLVNNTTESFILLDSKLKIISYNDQFERLYREYFGIRVNKGDSILKYAQPERLKTVKALYKRVLKGSSETTELALPVPGIGIKHFEIKYYPARDEKQNIIGVFVTALDVSEKHKAEDKEQKTKRILQEAEAISHVGSWEVNLDTGENYWSDEFYRICGYEPGTFEASTQKGLEIIHPEDVEKAKKALTHSIRTGEPYEVEKRILRPDGKIRHIRSLAKVEKIAGTGQRRLMGVFHDITEQKIAEEQLKKTLFALNERIKEQTCLFHIAQLGNLDLSAEQLLQQAVGYLPAGWQYSKITAASIMLGKKTVATPGFKKTKWLLKADRKTDDGEQLTILVSYKEKKPAADQGPFLKEEIQLINSIADNLIVNINRIRAKEKNEFERRDKEALINNTHDLMWSVSSDFRLIAANKPFIESLQRSTGFTIQPGDSLLLWDKLPEDFIRFWKKLYSRALKGESFIEEIYSPAAGNQSESWDDISFNPIFNGKKVVGIACSGRNISSFKKYEQSLISINQKLETAQQIARLGYWELDIINKTLYWSNEVYAIWGVKPGQITLSYEYFYNSIHPDDRELFDKAQQPALDGKGALNMEHRILLPDGSIRYVHEKGELVRNEAGQPIRFEGTVQDITDRKKSEETIRRSEEQRELIMKAALDAIICIDKEGLITFWNPQAEKIFGWKEGEVMGHLLSSFIISESHRKRYDEGIKSYMKTGHGLVLNTLLELNANRKTGELFPIELTILPIKQGNNEFFCAFIRDITERKNVLQQMRESEERYRYLFNSSPIPKWIYDLETFRILEVNDAAINHYGYSREQFLSMTIKQIRPPEDAEPVVKANQHINNIGTIRFGQWRHLKANGTLIDVEIAGHKTTHKGRDVMMVACVDVTKREKALQELAASNERFEYVQKATFDAIWDWDLATNELYLGDGYTSLFGHSLANNKGDLSIWSNKIHPDDSEKIHRHLAQAIENPVIQKWSDEYRYLKHDGSYAFVIDKAVIIRDAEGKATRMIGAMTDVTQLKEAENKLANERNLLRILVDTLPDYVYVKDRATRHILNNKKMLDLLGVANEEETLNKTLADFFPPKEAEIYLADDREVISSGKPVIEKIEPLHTPAETRWLSTTKIPIKENGNITGLVGISRDITDFIRAQQEKELALSINRIFSSEEELETCLEQMLKECCQQFGQQAAEAWVTNIDQTIIRLAATHGEARSLAGYEKNMAFKPGEGLVGTTWLRQTHFFIKNLDTDKLYKRQEYARMNQLESATAIPILYKNAVTAVLVFYNSHKAANGPVSVKVGSTLLAQLGGDIHRKKAELELNSFFNYAPELLCIAGPDGYFKKVNPAFCNLLGYTEEELTTQPFFHFVHPDDMQNTVTRLEDATTGNVVTSFENRYRTKDGNWKWISWSSSDLIAEEGLVFGYGKDVTETRKLKDLLDKASELARIGSWEVDLVHNTLYWSKVTRIIHEVDDDFVPTLEDGINFYKAGESRDVIKKAVQEAVEQGKAWDLEVEFVTAKGNIRWVRAIGEAEFSEGRCIRIYGSFQDIHEKKQLELERTQILESISDAFYAVDSNWNFTYFNKEAENLLGRRAEELIGKNIWREFPSANETIIISKYEQVAAENKPQTFEYYFPGTDSWYEINAYPSNGGVSAYFRNIDERRKAAIALRKAYEEKNNILESITDGFFTVDRNWIVTYWNKEAERMLRTSREQIVNKNIWHIFTDAQNLASYDKYHKAIEEQVAVHFEDYYEPIQTWFEISAYPSEAGLSVYFKDVTERKKSDEAIRISNERFNMVAKATNDSIWDWNLLEDKTIRTGNGFKNLFGYDIEEAKNDNLFWTKRLHPEDMERVLYSQQKAFGDPEENYWEDEYRFKKASGQYAHVYDKGYIIRDENGRAIRMIGATQDITQQKEQVNEIIRIQQNLDSLINTTSDHIWSVDKHLRVITVNKAYNDFVSRFTGRPVIEGDYILIDQLGAESKKRWIGAYQRVLSGEQFSIEETTFDPLINSHICRIISFSPITDKKGKVVGAACYAKDVTELKDSEARLKELNNSLLKKTQELTASNAELERFAYVASHDLQEPLRMISSFLQLLEKKYKNHFDETGTQYIQFAVNGAERMKVLIQDLLDYSKMNSTEDRMEKTDMNEVLQEVLTVLKPKIQETGASIDSVQLPVLPRARKAQMTQLLQNLLSNALKYRGESTPEIQIKVSDEHNNWLFSIKDNGIGIDPKYFQKIFIIFQRLHNKNEYSGTGIGLSVCKKIVERHGGRIWVESAPGKGSTFYFSIPKNYL